MFKKKLRGHNMGLFDRIREDKIKRDEELKIKKYLDNELKIAYSAFENENYPAALFYFNNILSYGNVPAIQNDKAVTLMMLHRFPEAIECLREISTDAPKEILENVYINMGKAYFYLDNMDMASFWLRKHRYLNPHSSSARELEHMIEKRTDELRMEYMNNQYHELRKDPEMRTLMDKRREETEQRIRRNLEKSNSNMTSSYSGLKECPNCYNKIDTDSYIYKVKKQCPYCGHDFSLDIPKKTFGKEMICPKCGRKFSRSGYAYSTEGKCPHCKQKI